MRRLFANALSGIDEKRILHNYRAIFGYNLIWVANKADFNEKTSINGDYKQSLLAVADCLV